MRTTRAIYGLWWCEKCDQWFHAKGSHDCTKKNTVETTSDNFRKAARGHIKANLRHRIKRLSDNRAGSSRNPEAADPEPVAGGSGGLNQDIPNNDRGRIAVRAEADVEDMGELGASDVSEWQCLLWLQTLSWNEVSGLVGAQTYYRPSGKYTGPFHIAWRKCVAMTMKLHGSSVDDTRLLSKKLTFMLVRLIYAPVEGSRCGYQQGVVAEGYSLSERGVGGSA